MKYLLTLALTIFLSNLHANSTIVMPEFSNKFHNVRDFTIYKSEAYFSAQSALGELSVIIRVEKNDDSWSNPRIASFSGNHHDIEPFITSNGLKLFFASKRPKTENSQTIDYDIWYVTREQVNKQWSKPQNIGSPINTDKNEFYPSIADNGNLYFTANHEDSKGKDDIYISEFNHGKYTKPYSLSNAINSEGDEYNAYIAHDESFLIFGAYKRKDGFGSGDLYISFKTDNKWSQAQNMGPEVNSKQMDYCPFVEAHTLFFTSRRSELKDNNFKNIEDLIIAYHSYKNGMSRIYKTDLKLKY